MKICDVVLNSIWYDPRVRKQLVSYLDNGNETVCVGFRCERYDAQKVAELPCPATIVDIGEEYRGQLPSLRLKLRRLKLKHRAICDAIIAYKPDLIHANDLNVLIGAYRASRKLKCRLVYDAHEINIENIGSDKTAKLMKRAMELVERYIMKRTDLNVCTNHAAADYFAEKYHIAPPMVVTNCTLKKEAAIPTKKHDGFEVLNHGRFYAGRGYDLLIEAAPLLKDLPDVKLALRGYGTIEEQLKNRCAELNADNVVFYPPVRVEELIQSASESHVGVAITEPICLNFKLSVSNKLFEYAAAGLPVIMSDIPEHRYLNEKYRFGIVVPENTPEALAAAINQLYSDKALYARCAENAIKLSKEINWENEFGKLISAENLM